MGGGESEKEEEEEDWPAPCVTGARLVDAPVLFFVATHKAFRGELSSLHRAAAEAAVGGAVGRELVVDLRRRLEFLKLVFNYHCSAEDEVIFLALDAQVKNVVPTYSLEHKSIEANFGSIFRHLDRLINNDEDSQMFQELLFSIGTVQTMICQHMHKEEEQVFPLVMKKFDPEQQSQLVWQYICSVPTVLLEEFFPWMTLYLTKDEKLDLIHCINLILPKERLLQEVFVSWIQREESSYKGENIYRKGCELLNLLSDSKLIAPQIHGELGQQLDKVCSVPIKGVYLWHAALRRDFDRILEELYEIRSSDCFSSLSSVVVQIKFIADAIIFYSNSLDKFFHRFLDIAKNSVSSCSPLIDEYQIKCLRSLLYYKCQDLSQLEMLCQELESLVNGLAEKLAFLETEIFPSIIETCTAETQLWLLYTSLSTMPLGMLKCIVSWFSAHLTDNQSNYILNNVKMGCHSISNSFTSLLHEWVRIARSGKISTDKFRQNLIETFNGRTFYLSEQNRTIILSDHKRASSSNGMNLHTFYKTMPPLQTNPVISDNDANFPKLDSRPMDLVFYIHRALVEDLKYLVSLSAKLSENPGLFPEFKNRFDIFHNIYQIHSNSEDEIAFPALESKGALRNISHSYCIDHKLEVKHFTRISTTLNEISELHGRGIEHYRLCLKLHDTCMAMHKVLSDHIYREEVEIFPLFRQCFSIEEEGKILGQMLGRTRAEAIQKMLPWLMTYLTSDEQNAVMSSWLKIARNTKFDEWLGEWWEGMTRHNNNNNISTVEYSPSVASDPLEVVSKYLLKEVGTRGGGAEKEFHFEKVDEPKFGGGAEEKGSKKGKTRCDDVAEIGNNKECRESNNKEHPLNMTQEELEATIRRVSRDSNLDSQKKSHIIQNLLMSRWIITQKMSSQESSPMGNHEGEIPGQSPSYRDPQNLTFGCSHYKRNCKLVAPCCNKLYTCIRCHDELTDHSVDRKAITKMMCMKCMVIQPVGPKCTTQSCNGFSMARYYCKICKLFDDERQIYHCPYCNLCRLGKGLGIEYFHCMKCNACMSKLLFVHVCREKCLEDNCPICHEYIFTSNSPVKALPCGHLMHSSCFQDYTRSHYVCPICSKSLGDMQVYFGMLDALLAEEKMPEEYSGQTQVILCNDCEKRGTASFHWLYHKCPNCGSYNTRLL
ncbi:hypothetical protein ACP275_09G033300 [Erythranthe tilingii]